MSARSQLRSPRAPRCLPGRDLQIAEHNAIIADRDAKIAKLMADVVVLQIVQRVRGESSRSPARIVLMLISDRWDGGMKKLFATQRTSVRTRAA